MTDDLKGDRPEWVRYRRPPGEDGSSAGGGDAIDPGSGPSGSADEPPGPAAPPALTAPADPPAPPALAAPPALTAPPVPLAPPVTPAWDPGPPLPHELEFRIRRDLARGRWIVRLTWVAALASLVLGLVAVRQAALLVAIDRRLVTTEEVQAASASFDVARAVLIATVALGVLLTIRWLRGALPVIAELRVRGVVDGPAPGSDRLRDQLPLLWRAAGVPADRAGWSDLRVGSGRRLAAVTFGVVIAAVIVGLAAAIWLGAARDSDTSRALRVVSGFDGGLWLVASVLGGVVLDAIRWREAAAARALGVFIPLVDAPARPIARLIPPILVFAAGIVIASGRPEPWFVPCPQATLACDGMLVPVDHDGGSTATIWIVYAIHRAEGPPVGTLAIAVGGPGISGLDSALGIIDNLDGTLVKRYDLLFFDQRGVGASEGRDCPKAGSVYATSTPGADAARVFVPACVGEAEVDPATLARYSTHQASEDLESIRLRLGIDRIAVYGESYGSELAQAYAALHPDRLTALILDGAVDVTRSANDFWADAATGFSDVLDATFDACTRDPDCRHDVTDPAGTYDRLIRQFRDGAEVEFADADGEVRSHPVQADGIEAAVDALLYEPVGRMLIERAIAASDHGDLVPAARLVAAVVGGGAGAGSSFAYHAITCADYRVSPTADPHDLAAVEAAGVAAGVPTRRTDEVYTSQYPCLYWPYQPADGTRPAPLTTTPFPVFVLGATDDPITPPDQARAIAGRLDDAYLIITDGGPHVTFGRNQACVDDPVVAFLIEGRRPDSRSITCAGEVAVNYIPLTSSAAAAGDDDALDAMRATESELFADPFYRLWDGGEDLRIGCRHGGFVAITPGTGQDGIRFGACAFVSGLPLTGSGTYVFDGGRTTWSVTTPDGNLDYVSADDGQHVSGTWKGAPVDITR